MKIKDFSSTEGVEDRRPSTLETVLTAPKRASVAVAGVMIDAYTRRRNAAMTDADRSSYSKVASDRMKARDADTATKRLKNYNRDRESSGDAQVLSELRRAASAQIHEIEARRKPIKKR